MAKRLAIDCSDEDLFQFLRDQAEAAWQSGRKVDAVLYARAGNAVRSKRMVQMPKDFAAENAVLRDLLEAAHRKIERLEPVAQ